MLIEILKNKKRLFLIKYKKWIIYNIFIYIYIYIYKNKQIVSLLLILLLLLFFIGSTFLFLYFLLLICGGRKGVKLLIYSILNLLFVEKLSWKKKKLNLTD